MLSCEADERMILNVPCNPFRCWLSIGAIWRCVRRGQREKVTLCPPPSFPFFFFCLFGCWSAWLSLFFILSQPLSLRQTANNWFDPSLSVLQPPSLSHTTLAHTHPRLVRLNIIIFFLLSSPEPASGFLCLAACITACQISHFDYSI